MPANLCDLRLGTTPRIAEVAGSNNNSLDLCRDLFVPLTPHQRTEINSQLDQVRARLYALEIPTDLDMNNWKSLFAERRRLERMLAEDRWIDEDTPPSSAI